MSCFIKHFIYHSKLLIHNVHQPDCLFVSGGVPWFQMLLLTGRLALVSRLRSAYQELNTELHEGLANLVFVHYFMQVKDSDQVDGGDDGTEVGPLLLQPAA